MTKKDAFAQLTCLARVGFNLIWHKKAWTGTRSNNLLTNVPGHISGQQKDRQHPSFAVSFHQKYLRFPFANKAVQIDKVWEEFLELKRLYVMSGK